jgi:dethiobiotin synthetase
MSSAKTICDQRPSRGDDSFAQGAKPSRAPGLFVTGTDTGAGKTVLSAALVGAIAAAGERAQAIKLVLTGLDEQGGCWPADHELLGALAGMPPEDVAPLRFGPAVAPHLAARLERRALCAEQIIACARAACERASRSRATLVVEGVGGLLCPLSDHLTVADVAAELALPVLIASRPGLGTINHTLLTLEAARARGLDVRAVVLTPWPAAPAPIELSNRATIEERGGVEVAVLDRVEAPRAPALARAGGRLPWRSWLAPAEARPDGARCAAAPRLRARAPELSRRPLPALPQRP